MNDRDNLIEYLRRILDLLPWVPESMSRTLHTACLKAIRRLMANGWIDPGEAVQLNHRVRDTVRNRQPSRCGFDTKEKNQK